MYNTHPTPQSAIEEFRQRLPIDVMTLKEIGFYAFANGLEEGSMSIGQAEEIVDRFLLEHNVDISDQGRLTDLAMLALDDIGIIK